MDERIYNRNRKWTRETFLDNFTVAEERHAARRLLDVARDSGAAFHWGPSGVSIRMRCSLWGNPSLRRLALPAVNHRQRVDENPRFLFRSRNT